MLSCATKHVAGHILCVYTILTYGVFCVCTTWDRGQKMLRLDISQAEGKKYISNNRVQVSYVDTPYNRVVCGWIMCVQFEFGYSWFLISECVFWHCKMKMEKSVLCYQKTLPTFQINASVIIRANLIAVHYRGYVTGCHWSVTIVYFPCYTCIWGA